MNIPKHSKSGELPEGEFKVSLEKIRASFGDGNPTRKKLMLGLEQACENFKNAGVKNIWINGSFITTKEQPNDIDGCWEYSDRVNLNRLDPVFLMESRIPMKEKYGLEFFPACFIEGDTGVPFPKFFQTNRNGEAKGILIVNLGGKNDYE